MPDLRAKLSLLVPGDIVRGHDSGGAILICLVEAVGPDRIETRRVTTQGHVTFDVETGEEVGNPESRLDTLEPLSVDMHNVLLGLDRKMRLGTLPLSEAEKEALQFVADFYSAHPVEAFRIVGT
ncbi:MAG: hypothetical protein LCH95_12455 [Proteobacteria bacterium]|nr:hypothetical protein [Pseudomonadota bacterium]